MVKEWKLKALTNIWTGDAARKPDRLILTGIMGSLRWWYEVLVRGLGGKACDPTSNVRCPDKDGRHCVACELFGCTGWARKFRLMILDEKGQVIQNQIKANQTFTLDFITLRPIRDEEWCLLDATLRLIADYGAIGGKTVFKPSDEQNRQNEPHHKDFGLVTITQQPKGLSCKREDVENYMCNEQWRRDFNDSTFAWASLTNFWCVKGRYLARKDANKSSFNFVIGRPEPKSQSSQGDSWLAGRQQESKKVFSFKQPSNACRTFGFVQNAEEVCQICEKLEILRYGVANGRQPDPVWQCFDPGNDFLTGQKILGQLF
ncbi:MAG: type III-B CRISPR module RAMP protein Cmr1 [Chloroflexus sp.]|uniref:type III-B CRISPR module RAMP protein Cmr1 n=1 Tax=Chloroflexus sp. TaxID=1904827 RepID=UPI003D12EDFB